MRRFCLFFAVLALFFGCGKKEPPAAPDTETSVVEDTPHDDYPFGETDFDDASQKNENFDSLPFRPAINKNINFGDFSADFKAVSFNSPYTAVRVQPKVRDYRVAPGLSNVENLNQFKDLSAEQLKYIEKNGFVVRPGTNKQLFWIYEANNYEDIPLFISADSVLQLYHLFYDFCLRSVEKEKLYENAVELNEAMIAALVQMRGEIEDKETTKQLMLCIGYFGVAQLAFGAELPAVFPQELRERVEKEYQMVLAARGMGFSPLYGDELYTIYGPFLDYSMFKPRGHYTRSVELTRYFRGMMWYGLVPNQFYTVRGEKMTGAAARTMLTVIALGRMPEGKKLWESIYWTTAFFTGTADDGTPLDYGPLVQKMMGTAPRLNDIPSMIDAFFAEVDKLPSPKIVPNQWDSRFAKQFQFMGQRYLPDTEILQRLTNRDLREFPSGLDVFAVFGSPRAAHLIKEYQNPAAKWPAYPALFEVQKERFSRFRETDWRSTMYNGWLWSQQALLGSYGQGYPFFMRNNAWEDKSLATALGSWTELKHDTILYGKQNNAESGGGGDPPPILHSYVEPNPELYNRLLWLTSFSRQNLKARGILPAFTEETALKIEALLQSLLNYSLKELNGEELSNKEKEELRYYGGMLEHLSARIVLGNQGDWYNIVSETDKDMALIADCGSGKDGVNYLEEAVGRAAEIFVVCPAMGKLYLTRGAVFDYYEFISRVRINDEEWQAMLNEGKAPPRPAWTASFLK